jgi:hypothetical protein
MQQIVARAPSSCAAERIALTDPSSAFTGLPSAPVILSGSAKKAR